MHKSKRRQHDIDPTSPATINLVAIGTGPFSVQLTWKVLLSDSGEKFACGYQAHAMQLPADVAPARSILVAVVRE